MELTGKVLRAMLACAKGKGVHRYALDTLRFEPCGELVATDGAMLMVLGIEPGPKDAMGFNLSRTSARQLAAFAGDRAVAPTKWPEKADADEVTFWHVGKVGPRLTLPIEHGKPYPDHRRVEYDEPPSIRLRVDARRLGKLLAVVEAASAKGDIARVWLERLPENHQIVVRTDTDAAKLRGRVMQCDVEGMIG